MEVNEFVVSYILTSKDTETGQWLGSTVVTTLPQVNDEISIGSRTYTVKAVIDRNGTTEIQVEQ